MHLLRARPAGHDIDDGVNAVYECQACLAVWNWIMDADNTPDHVRCHICGYYEGDENAHD